MRPPIIAKYRFRIRTRAGVMLDNLIIPGRDPGEAERKLRQLYRDCEVLDRNPPPDVAAQLQSCLASAGVGNVVNLFTPASKKVVGL